MSVVCLVSLPGFDGFTEELVFSRVPCVGEEIELGIDGEGSWPEQLLGQIFRIKSVQWCAEAPNDKINGAYIVLGR